jgi:hypothetical protein
VDDLLLAPGGELVAVSWDGFTVLDATGRQLQQVFVDVSQSRHVAAAALGADGTLLLTRADSRQLLAYSLDGKLCWPYEDRDVIVGTPVIDREGNIQLFALGYAIEHVTDPAGDFDLPQLASASALSVDRSGRLRWKSALPGLPQRKRGYYALHPGQRDRERLAARQCNCHAQYSAIVPAGCVAEWSAAGVGCLGGSGRECCRTEQRG